MALCLGVLSAISRQGSTTKYTLVQEVLGAALGSKSGGGHE